MTDDLNTETEDKTDTKMEGQSGNVVIVTETFTGLLT